MDKHFDVIVLGAGGFGSGTLYHLARRGLRVLGIERFSVPHHHGSSHGETRIIRKAYFEHPDYVPLLMRAYDLWEDLEAETGRRLYHPCGLLLAGPPEGETVAGARLSARRHAIPLEDLPPDEARRRFPGFRFPEGFDVVYEPAAGFLEVEACVRAHLLRAQELGATLRTNEAVLEWKSDGRSVRVWTQCNQYTAAALVITVGAWANQLLSELKLPLQVLRKALLWYPTQDADHDVQRGAAAYLFELSHGAFYGFPSIDGATVKVAEHSGGEPVADPLWVDRSLRPVDVRGVFRFLSEVMPGVRAAHPVRHAVCLYTMTPDRHFIVDRHPELENVIVAAGFSGHGFKFTGVLGAALADLATEGRTGLPIGFLAIDRDALRTEPRA